MDAKYKDMIRSFVRARGDADKLQDQIRDNLKKIIAQAKADHGTDYRGLAKIMQISGEAANGGNYVAVCVSKPYSAGPEFIARLERLIRDED